MSNQEPTFVKVEPAARSEEALRKIYGTEAVKTLAKNEAAKPDPFFDDETRRKDPLYAAKYAGGEITKAIVLLANEYGLTAGETIYAVELARCNVTRSADLPVRPEHVPKIQAKAVAYYEANVDEAERLKREAAGG